MSGWEVRLSRSKNAPYFYNDDTKVSSWEVPAELSKEDVANLPGAHYLNDGSGDAGKPERVQASHLLVKHADSRRPSSWKEKNIKRTKEEAIDILKGYQTQIGGDPAKFAELAKLHSDCSSHEQGGDLGWFGHGQMQKPFEDASFALQVNQMSDVISTDSGVHLILRTA